jgi:hypothetical protein
VKERPTTYFFPVCQHDLRAVKTKHKIALFCPFFLCSDSRMNEGAVGRTTAEAYHKLKRKIR